jgi:hypothetical protein
MRSSESIRRSIAPQCTAVHGCRSSFRTWAFEAPHPREIAEAALAHKVPGGEGIYQGGTSLEKRRLLMRDWALHVTQSNVIPIGDNVTALRRTA